MVGKSVRDGEGEEMERLLQACACACVQACVDVYARVGQAGSLSTTEGVKLKDASRLLNPVQSTRVPGNALRQQTKMT